MDYIILFDKSCAHNCARTFVVEAWLSGFGLSYSIYVLPFIIAYRFFGIKKILSLDLKLNGIVYVWWCRATIEDIKWDREHKNTLRLYKDVRVLHFFCSAHEICVKDRFKFFFYLVTPSFASYYFFSPRRFDLLESGEISFTRHRYTKLTFFVRPEDLLG